ncbi:MAG: hypothetical protein N2510_04455 [Ignavibacteria bacterium]|nr:hypothetical protein [Ignavibacteria bacterium]
MITKWETKEERISKFMKISPEKKLEWLGKMHEFKLKMSSKQRKKISMKLKKLHNQT